MKEREMKNITGIIRAVDRGDGICELVKEPDVLCIMPVRSRRKARKLLSAALTIGTFLGAALAVIYLAPALGTILFALLAGLMVWAMLMGDE